MNLAAPCGFCRGSPPVPILRFFGALRTGWRNYFPRRVFDRDVGFTGIPTILTPQELMDKAFARAARIEKPDRDRRHRVRKTTVGQLEAVRNILNDALGRYTRRFPSLDQLTPYHKELIDLLIGSDEYRLALGRVEQGRKNLVQFINREMASISGELEIQVLMDTKRKTYGRVSSQLRGLQEPLRDLAHFREILRRLPTVAPDLFTVVVAGYPNVGKSSLITALTDAEPEVASYPFTTKEAHVGHMIIEDEERERWAPSGQKGRWREHLMRVQVIDTPGLLDRPAARRNPIEQQAALALRHLADIVLFLRDPTGHCGYPVEDQEGLLAEVRELVPDAPLFLVETKIDLNAELPVPDEVHPDADDEEEGKDPGLLRVSTVTGAGMERLRGLLLKEAMRPRQEADLEAYLRGESGPGTT